MLSATSNPPPNSGLVYFFCLQLIAAALLYYCDILVGVRLNFWMGWGAADWVATLPGFMIYAATTTVLAGLTTLVTSRFILRKSDVRIIAYIATLISVILLTFLLQRFSQPKAEQYILPYAFIAPGTVAIVGLLGCINRSIAWTVFCGVFGIGGGLCLLQVFALTLFTFDNGHDAANAYATAWAGIITVAAGILHAARNRSLVRKTILTAAAVITSFALPIIVFALSPTGKPTDQPDRKNVLLITADTMRADYTSAYGGAVPTPNLDRLAAIGMRLDQYYSLAPWTVPSFSGLFSSKYPPSVTLNKTYNERMEELSYYRNIPEYWEGKEGRSLVQNLSESSYTTNAFVGNFAMFGHAWLLGDFDRHMLMPMLLNRTIGPLDDLPLMSAIIMKLKPEAYQDRPFDYTRAVTEHAQAFLRFRTNGNFFLWVHFFDPHTPYDPPLRFRRITDGPYDFFPIGATMEMLQQHDYMQSLYEGEIRYVDESVGKILYTLKQVDHDDDTIVVFSSDHGEEFWDHNGFGHGHTMFNEQLRVPFIIAGSGILPGTIRTPISAIDVIPTLAELTGEEFYSEWRGTSFLPILRGDSEKTHKRPVFSQATGLLPPSPEPLQSVIVWPYKLIRGMETDNIQLYNLSIDPGETNNLASSHTEQKNELSEVLRIWSTTFPVTFTELSNNSGDIEADEETLEYLRSIGYLE
ncbi:MAG TPA: hypothetical protein EYN96_05965 [Candidatus Hydrogenedentes bacterium]|nr:hypothetical protein [Candidatus Hydrogenedentota bacterium]